jgi:phage-related minor tail protein
LSFTVGTNIMEHSYFEQPRASSDDQLALCNEILVLNVPWVVIVKAWEALEYKHDIRQIFEVLFESHGLIIAFIYSVVQG